MRSTDVHQHLWPTGVLRVLERRTEVPRATWAGGRWRLALRREPRFDVRPADHDPETRARALGVEHALVALSSPVGVDALPEREALAAIDAWQEAGKALPPAFGWWAAVPTSLQGDEGSDLAREVIMEGAAGICVPATSLATPAAAARMLPLLETVASAGATAFIHPGPTAPPSDRKAPAWWASATDYVAQQHAAWHAFHLILRPQLPKLRVIFALLAGLAPLHAARTAQRSRNALDLALADQLCFYDTSSYGPRAVTFTASAVGIGQLVHGSDYPVAPSSADPVEEAFNRGVADLVQRDAPARALGHTWIPA